MSTKYLKLKGKMMTEGYKADSFAEALGLDPSSLSRKLNEKSAWKDSEIMKACQVLNIPLDELHSYFFTQ